MLDNFPKIFHEKFGFKVFATFTIFIVIISSSFTILFINHQRKDLTDNIIKNGKLLAGILAYNSRIGVFSENEQLLKDSIEGIFQQEDVIEVSIFNNQGKLLKKKELLTEYNDGEGAVRSFRIAESKERDINKILERLKADSSTLYFEGQDQLEFWASVVSGAGYCAEENLFFEEKPLQR